MSICDGCIHDDVCGLEDNHEEGIVSCADMIPKDVLEKIKVEITEEIEAYRIVLGLEEDISDSNGIGSNYLIGQLRANKEIIEHLRELIDESNYDEEEQHD